MAKWTGVITNAGNSLINAWVGEKTLRFDCAKAGTGTVEIAAMMAQTDLVSQKQDAGILSAESVDGGIRLKLRVTASQEGYLLNQFGVWASVDGNTALIAIYQHESGVSVPSMDDSPDFVFTFYALIMTSNTGTWTVNIDTSALVTHDDMNSAIAESVKNCLPISGGGLTGELRMNGNPISGLIEPTEESQAVNKAYADKIAETANIAKETAESALPKSGGTMTGSLAMGGNRIGTLGYPLYPENAATKGYVDAAKAEAKAYTDTAKEEANSYTDSRHITKTATITTTWTGSGPYTQSITVSGILASDLPHITPVYSTTNATAIAQKEAWACVSKADAGLGVITFTCFEDKPETEIPIQIEVNR